MKLRHRLATHALRILLLSLVATPAWSHEGHDHGAPEPVATDPNLVVRSASSADYEVVLKYRTTRGQKSTTARIYLSDFATNAPVEGARITLRATTPRQVNATVTATSPGIYEATLAHDQAARYAVILAVGGSPGAEFAFQNLPMGEDPATVAARPAATRGRPSPWLMGAILLVLLATVAIVVRRRSLKPISRAALLLLVSAAVATFGWHASFAGEGDPPARPTSATASDGPSPARYVPKESQFFLGVRTIVVRLESLRARIHAVGHVVPESGALATVGAPRDGKLEQVGRRLAVGDRVRQGQVIANLLVIDRLPIRAPISGLVAEVRFTTGQWVQAGDPLVVILDERRVRVELPLFGENLNRALRTREAVVTTSALPGMQFPARVRGLAPTASEPAAGSEAGSAGSPIPPVVLTVVNRGGLLRPGMLVEASLELPTAEELIAVPESAIIHQESGAAVFVHTGPEVFEQREVRIVGRYGNRVGISGAVRAGDRIVTEAAQGMVSAPLVQARVPVASDKSAP